MQNNIQVFNNADFYVRTINDDNGIVWFVAKDIAETLEYSLDGGMGRIFGHVPDVWKGGKRIATVTRGEQEMLCLTEQGVYFFLGRSDKPKALPYQLWIAGDVVPSIRRTGSYSVQKKQLQPGKDKDNMQLPSIQGLMKAADRIIHKAFNCKEEKDFQETLALDEIFKKLYGKSALQLAGLKLSKQLVEVPTDYYERLRDYSLGWTKQVQVFVWTHPYDLNERADY